MTRPVISVAAVSYLNTIPFLYGIRHSKTLSANLLLSPPAGCAEAFKNHKADIALIPVGALDTLEKETFDIVTSWCIGAEGPVRTVVLASDSPLKEIKRVWLDSHSLTSVRLAKLLAAQSWKIAPEWAELTDYSALENHTAENPAAGNIKAGDAFVLIGDKVFEAEGRFSHVWDLAEEWEKFAKLPFVFAVWVARKNVPEETVDALEQALSLGVERIYEAIQESDYADREYAYDYLTRNIDYIFDGPKHRALEKFLTFKTARP